MKKVLVTGASGFIGYHCLGPLLQRGYEVHAVQSRTQPVAFPNVIWHHANLFDVASLQHLINEVNPTHLLHLAWYVAPGKAIDSLDNAFWVQRSLDLLREFHAVGGQRITFSGSCDEYDWRYGYCSETLTPTTPDTYYGICKNSLHELVRFYCHLTGISYSWGRIFFLYGPRENPNRLVSSVIRNLLAGKPAPCSHGEQIRDYMSVEDVADGLVTLLDGDFVGPCNIGCGQPIQLKTIVTRIGEIIGRPDLVKLGALPARANDLPLVLADTARLFETVGWRPRHDLESGLRRTVDWWSQYLPQQEN